MANHVDIYDFNNITFLECLSESFSTDPDLIKSFISIKPQFNYLLGYLHELNCKSILIERNYVDVDYLDDYVEYFAKCFVGYSKHCTRLHFFSSFLNQEIYTSSLLSNNHTSLFDSYLGFIVVRPLPTRMIGRSCLKTYSDNGSRFYGATRDYLVHLHGLIFTVKSLAYQEQDSISAACATTAIWSALHGSAILFQHQIPTPIHITKHASENMPISSRPIPSTGLTIEEMIRAIRSVGLEFDNISVLNLPELFKASIYAYTQFGLPIIVAVHLLEKAITPNGEEFNIMGHHAVTVCGYNLLDSSISDYSELRINTSSQKINKVYIHDDQIGPFSRSEIVKNSIEYNIRGTRYISSYYLTTSWLDSNKEDGNVVMVPYSIIIPLYHKIRISLFNIIRLCNKRIALWARDNTSNRDHLRENLTWDIQLSTIGKVKEYILNNNNIDKHIKIKYLYMNFPKFLWHVNLYLSNQHIKVTIYDATDIYTDPVNNHLLIADINLL